MFKIALAQIEIIPGQPDINFYNMSQAIQDAKQQKVDFIIFPEMSIPGYLLGDLWEQDAFIRDCEYYGQEIVNLADDITIIFGNVGVDWQKKGDDGRTRKYNSLFVAHHQQLHSPINYPYPYIIKTLLPNYREFDDSRHFYALPKLAQELSVDIDSLFQPVTIRTDRHSQINIGCLICEDSWCEDYAIKPFATINKNFSEANAGKKLDFFVNISCSPYNIGKNIKRHNIFSQHAASVSTPIVYVNNVGIQNNGKTIFTFDGASTVYDQCGKVLHTCQLFSTALSVITLEKSMTASSSPSCNPLQLQPGDSIEVIYQALTYGIKKFMDSIGMKKVVIGASGGIDSALSAAVYCKILGAENVLLVNMPSVYNSATTKSLAHALANNLKCLYTVVSVQTSVEHTIAQINDATIQNLAKQSSFSIPITPFVAENIQARDRSARILAAIAAAWGAGFTCNANKSETTIGYSTLYGDHAGFLAAFADLWKYQVYDLAKYINEKIYGYEVIPQGSIDIVPSAELSDKQNVDQGQGDPLIYPYHDRLFCAFVEKWHKITPEEILSWYIDGSLEEKINCPHGIISRIFPDAASFINDLERWWNLFGGMAVAKRIQAPPIISLNKRTYGFDHRESQIKPYYTRNYKRLKQQVYQ